jgi:hypothetical protein
LGGVAIRMMTMFKQFPLTMITKHWNRELHRMGKVDRAGVANLLVGTTVLGFLSLYLSELTKGRTFRAPEDGKETAEMFAAAMLKGGAASLYADLIIGSTEHHSNSLADFLAGPVVSKADRFRQVLVAAREGDDPSSQLVRATAGVIPGNNLFYTRLGVDYLFLHALQEHANPGYLRRLERRVERDRPVEWWLPPTSAMNQ